MSTASTRQILLMPVACLAAALLAAPALAVDVDLDPAPQIPLPVGQSQPFLVTLSKADAEIRGKVSFAELPEGIAAEPKEQAFTLEAGKSVQLVFKITCTAWGQNATLRPTVSVEGSEPVNFPEQLKTTVIRDQKLLDKPPVDDKGLLFYYSFGDGHPGHSNSNIFADKFVGEKSMWNEGLWNAAGGVKGNASWGCSGEAECKIAFAPLNNVDHRKGTILFWLRKSTRVNEIRYNDPARMGYDETWKIGPTICRGTEGEGIFGANWTPQDVASRRFKDWKKKPDSDSFISLRRYKAVGERRGYLEATYLGLRQRRYTTRAWFDWSRDWHHVAVAWDTDARKLEIYIDGQAAGDKIRTNGKDEADPAWYPGPWHIGILGENAQFGVIQYTSEGSVNVTDRDEFYVYNRPFSADEIQANMKAAMGKAPTPLIEAAVVRLAPTSQPAAQKFHDRLPVQVQALWSNSVQRYSLDGNDPDESSPAYDKPILLKQTTTLKVRSFLKGYQPSDVAMAKFESLGPDKTKPTVQDVVAINDGKSRSLLVVFTKKVDRPTAEMTDNYTLTGCKVAQARLDEDQQTVRLSVEPDLAAGKEHALTVRAVKDITESANVMEEVKKTFALRPLPGLLAWWSFDVVDGWKVKDFGPNRIDGVAYCGLHFRGASLVEGRRGQAIYLKDAGDFVDVSKHTGNVESVNLDDLSVDRQSPLHGDAGSVFLWIKAKPGPKHARDIISKGYAYSLTMAGGELYVGNATGSGRKKVCPIADDAWHQLGLVFQNNVENGSKVYVDGELKTTLTMKFLPHVGTRLEICQPRNWGGSDAWLDGAIDEVMLFGRLMSDEEAKQLYKDGYLSPGPATAASQP